jgi:peptide/nickel transport system ATP-binding protein
VAENCDRIAIVYAGEVIERGTVREIFSNPGHPYTVGLFAALPNMNSDAEYLSPIHGMPPDPGNLPEGCKFHPRCPYAQEDCRHGVCSDIHLGGEHFCSCRHTELVASKGE